MLVSRNFARQGAPSERGDGIVTYVEEFESPDNEAYGDLYNQHRVPEAYGTQDMLIRRNRSRQGKTSD